MSPPFLLKYVNSHCNVTVPFDFLPGVFWSVVWLCCSPPAFTEDGAWSRLQCSCPSLTATIAVQAVLLSVGTIARLALFVVESHCWIISCVWGTVMPSSFAIKHRWFFPLGVYYWISEMSGCPLDSIQFCRLFFSFTKVISLFLKILTSDILVDHFPSGISVYG